MSCRCNGILEVSRNVGMDMLVRGAKSVSKKVTVEEPENTTKDTVNGNSLVSRG